MLFRSTEAQHVLDTSAVVPTPVKHHDLTLGRKMRHIALHVKLPLLAVGWRRQSHYSENTRADAFGERFYRSALARSVPPFKDDHDPQSLGLYILLKHAELLLQLAQFLHVFFVRQLPISVGFRNLAHEVTSAVRLC